MEVRNSQEISIGDGEIWRRRRQGDVKTRRAAFRKVKGEVQGSIRKAVRIVTREDL